MTRLDWLALGLVTAALCACATTRLREQRAAEYQQLVLLRGELLTAVRAHTLGRQEAFYVDGLLSTARRELDAGKPAPAAVELDAVQAYLKGRSP